MLSDPALTGPKRDFFLWYHVSPVMVVKKFRNQPDVHLQVAADVYAEIYKVKNVPQTFTAYCVIDRLRCFTFVCCVCMCVFMWLAV